VRSSPEIFGEPLHIDGTGAKDVPSSFEVRRLNCLFAGLQTYDRAHTTIVAEIT
jgi:hypothetical protein